MVATERAEQTMKYLSLLSQQFPNQQSVFTEIINLQAILNLPKGTEHFMSDLHGEYEPSCTSSTTARAYSRAC